MQTGSVPGSVIQAADYDLGVNGAAYYDKDTGNYYISTGKQSAGNKAGYTATTELISMEFHVKKKIIMWAVLKTVNGFNTLLIS